MTLVKCKNCGKEISDTTEKCIHCGEPLKDSKPKCPECKATLKNTDKFCPKCGYKIEKEEPFRCPKCLKEVDKDKNFCLYCGCPLHGTSPVASDKKKNTYALVGFILGLASTIAWLIPLFGVPTGIVGIVFSAKSKGSEKTAFTYVGLYLSIIFLVLACINSLLGYLIAVNETTYVDYIRDIAANYL